MPYKRLIRYTPKLLCLFAGLLLWFCSSCKDKQIPPPAEPYSDALPTQTLTLGGKDFTVELAFTRYTRGRGLMFRRELAANRGMLFIFTDARPRQFYMQNCLIDLDAVFIRPDGAIDSITTMLKPVEGQPLKYYSSDSPVQYVLELPAGTAEKLRLKPGQIIRLPDRIRGIVAETD